MLINPWNVEETSSILNDALLMDRDEKQGRYEFCNNYIRKANIHFWAESFLKGL